MCVCININIYIHVYMCICMYAYMYVWTSISIGVICVLPNLEEAIEFTIVPQSIYIILGWKKLQDSDLYTILCCCRCFKWVDYYQ